MTQSDRTPAWLVGLASWGEAEILRPLSGARNRLYEITLDGRSCFARRSDRSAASLEWELALLRMLASGGLAVPAPLSLPDGALSQDGVVVMPKIPGAPPDGSDDWHRVAEFLERLHDLTRDWPQRPDSAGAVDQPCAAGDVDLDQLPAAARAACLDAWRSLAEEPTSVVHGDPHPGNILIDGDTVALLDWDEARVDASILDIAALLAPQVNAPAWAGRAVDAWEVACSWRREPAYARERLAALQGDHC